VLEYHNVMMESLTTRGTMMKRGRMTWTMLYYLNDDDGKHNHSRDNDDKRADDLDDALLP
jgi:hypothetical protein